MDAKRPSLTCTPGGAAQGRKIRVLVVDDSALMREVLRRILSRDPAIEVIGTAGDPVAAETRMRTDPPDVLTLDVEMPRMDGLTFLEKLMRENPTPVVMISALTEQGCETALRALELGAVDIVTKPKLDIDRGTQALGQEIVEKVKAAACARPRRPAAPPPAAAGVAPPRAFVHPLLNGATHKVIAIGASTGGTEALLTVLRELPADAPGTVIVQHMPAGFTRAFANRLDGVCRVRVKEAEHGDRVIPGHVLIAPGDQHMVVVRDGASAVVRLNSDPPVGYHRPSVDVLFESCAKSLGANAVAAILTGMGADGARGLRAMRDAGARTVAQDEPSCVVYGMPREAVLQGGVEVVASLTDITSTLLRLLAEAGLDRPRGPVGGRKAA